MDTFVYVKGAERMVTAARLLPDGIYVRFADAMEGVIPLAELALPDFPLKLTVPDPHLVRLFLEGGGTEDIPWDFARHYVDEHYRSSSLNAGAQGRGLFAQRLRTLRSEMGVTQKELARRSGISRVSIARMEIGEQSPRYGTLTALAEALDVPLQQLLASS